MNNKFPSVGKTVAWVYGTVAVFTIVYFIGGALLDRLWQQKEQKP
jgi:hypothetical protein